MEKITIIDADPNEVIRIAIQCRRHARLLAPGEKHPTAEEKSRQIRMGQRGLALRAIKKYGAAVTVVGIEDEHAVILDVRGPKRGEIVEEIEQALDCVGGYLGKSSAGGPFEPHVRPAPRFESLEEALAAYDALVGRKPAF